jgi:hypothetical protein
MRPERRFKPGMDGGLTAAVLLSPPLHLRMDEILSKQWGPPHQLLGRGLQFTNLASVGTVPFYLWSLFFRLEQRLGTT